MKRSGLWLGVWLLSLVRRAAGGRLLLLVLVTNRAERGIHVRHGCRDGLDAAPEGFVPWSEGC